MSDIQKAEKALEAAKMERDSLISALKQVGFEVRSLPGQVDGEDSSVFRGSAPCDPAFGFAGAFKVRRFVWVDGQRKEGNFLVCVDPGTDNTMQVFEIESGRYIGY